MSNYIILIRLSKPAIHNARVTVIDDLTEFPESITDDGGNTWTLRSRVQEGISFNSEGEEVPFYVETWYTVEAEAATALHAYLHYPHHHTVEHPNGYVIRRPLEEYEPPQESNPSDLEN